jgi:hypothetical protein
MTSEMNAPTTEELWALLQEQTRRTEAKIAELVVSHG